MNNHVKSTYFELGIFVFLLLIVEDLDAFHYLICKCRVMIIDKAEIMPVLYFFCCTSLHVQ